MDATRILYPRGLLTRIAEANEKGNIVKRIELFARKQKDTYGIIRSFHVAYSAERKLLAMAGASNNVICVRSLESSGWINRDARRKRFVEDRLVLKRAELRVEQEINPILLMPNTPEISVSALWLEKVKLGPGDRLLVSNPIENYSVLPPNVA
ncbi:MAG: hypothetical protein ACYC7D_02545 [Nitrososphaerales archaeon]